MAQSKTSAKSATNTSAFDAAVAFVLRDRIEGGYVNDPRDPGGETNFGISKRAHPSVNIRELTKDQAVEIYKSDYWDAAGCNDLPAKIATAVFDCAVNQGVKVAGRLLQKSCGATPDGIVGPKTVAAVEKSISKSDEDELVLQFLGWRLRRYANTANSATYMRGWANRMLLLQRHLLTEAA